MKKIKNYLLFIFASVFLLLGKTNAVPLTQSEIPDGSYIIGTHMFTYSEKYPYTEYYDGNVNTAVVMLGSASFETESLKMQDSIIIYNKLFDDFWIDTLTGNLIESESYNFDILYVNGLCIDPVCTGDTYEVTYVYNDGITSDKILDVPYNDILTEPAKPTKLGHSFVCWTYEDSDECYDFSKPVEEDLVLEASWNTLEYTVTFTDTVSNKTKNITCNFTAGNRCSYKEFTDLFTLKEGYTFSGWSLAETGEKVYTSSSNFDNLFGEDTEFTLYSVFNSSDYAIYYNLKGGTFNTLESPTTVYDPSLLVYDISTPSRVGYTFGGWRVTKGDATISNNKITINAVSDIEIEASWVPVKYNVVYGTTNLNTSTCEYDKNCTLDLNKITVPAGKEVTKITATVNGTTYNLGTQVKNLISSPIGGKEISTVTATVTFDDIKYNVSYDFNGAIVSGNYGTEIIMGQTLNFAAPSRTGYTFGGWAVSEGSANVTNTSLKLKAAGDVKLTAKWTPHTYNLVYNGTTYGKCTYDESCTVTPLTSGIPAGKNFAKWSYSGGVIGNVVYNLTADNTDLTLSPVYEYITYGIIYDYNGGTVATTNTSTYNVDTASVNLTKPIKDGYTFSRWEVTSTNNVAKVNNTNTVLNINGATGDIKVVAVYTPVSFNVNYNLAGGIGKVTSHNCTYDSCTISNIVPTKTGYNFGGWIYESTGYIYESGKTVKINAKDDITLTAKWTTAKPLKINYVLDGGTFNGVANTTFYHGESASLSEPSKTGYKYLGWKVENAGDPVKVLSPTTNSDVSVYAVWEALSYTVTYNVDQYLDSNSSVSYTYDEEATLKDYSAEFAAKGYTLLGWSLENNGSLYYGANLKFVNLKDGLTNFDLYPVVQEITDDYVIGYYLDGGSFVNENDVDRSYNKGESLTLPEVTRLGYELVEWKLEDGTVVDGTETNINRDVVLIPVWEMTNKYTVTLSHTYEDNINPVKIECTFDTQCILPLNTAVRSGYDFTGWLHEMNGEGGNVTYSDGDEFLMIWETAVDQNTFDFVITSQWNATPYEISYNVKGNYPMGPEVYTIEDEYIMLPLTAETGFDHGYTSDFIAWSDSDGNIIDLCPGETDWACAPLPENLGNIEFTAHYADEKITVSWSYNYEYSGFMGNTDTKSDNGTITLTYGDRITGLPTEVEYGYGMLSGTAKISDWALDGVVLDLKLFRVTEDVSIEAQF